MLPQHPLNIDHPHKNPKSLSSPKSEICPKITILERFCEVWLGKFIRRQYTTLKEVKKLKKKLNDKFSLMWPRLKLGYNSRQKQKSNWNFHTSY